MSRIDAQPLLRVGGTVIRISDIRGFETNEHSRIVYLQNGMKLTVTKEERVMLQNHLEKESKRIVNSVRESGML